MAAHPRVAIVGAGPAGLYAADALTFDQNNGIRVDVIERLPTPFGLLRNGVAPDHLKIKSLEKLMQRIIERPAVRFFGNVTLGEQIAREELLGLYDAIIYAYGAPTDRRLGIAGEELRGCVSASDIVAWYNGHPECLLNVDTFSASKVAIIGVGNVALDVARILLVSRNRLWNTDIAARALQHLMTYRPTDVYIIGRRSVAQAKFTPKELRELGGLEDVDIIVDAAELAICDSDAQQMADRSELTLVLETLQSWAERPQKNAPHRIHFRFLLEPDRIEGSSQVEAIRLRRMKNDGSGSILATSQYVTLNVGAVIRSIGYRGKPVHGVPFDSKSGAVPNEGGRVITQRDAAAREFVTGWARRGANGVIGSNRGDATEVAESILASLKPAAVFRHHTDLEDVLLARGVEFVTGQRWAQIDSIERALGKERARPRVKLENIGELMKASRMSSGTPSKAERSVGQEIPE
jgi:ferredoxin--NADP+ reductase